MTTEEELAVARDQLQTAADRHWKDVQEIFSLTESDLPYVDVAVDNESFEPFIVRWYGPFGEQILEDLQRDLVENHPFDDLTPGTYRCGIGHEWDQVGEFGAIEIRGGWAFVEDEIAPLPARDGEEFPPAPGEG